MIAGDTGERRHRRGDPFTAAWTFATDAGTVFDLGSWGTTVRAQLRPYADSDTAVDFAVQANTPPGRLQLDLTAEQTAALEPGRYVWDAQAFTADSEPGPTFLCGSIVILTDITR